MLSNHSYRRFSRSREVTSSFTAGAFRRIAATKSAPVRSLPTGVLKQIGVRFLENAYSHNIELQADEFGARLADAALYDPYAAIKLLQQLNDWQKNKAGFQLPGYFSSHPPFAERIANLKQWLQER